MKVWLHFEFVRISTQVFKECVVSILNLLCCICQVMIIGSESINLDAINEVVCVVIISDPCVQVLGHAFCEMTEVGMIGRIHIRDWMPTSQRRSSSSNDLPLISGIFSLDMFKHSILDEPIQFNSVTLTLMLLLLPTVSVLSKKFLLCYE